VKNKDAIKGEKIVNFFALKIVTSNREHTSLRRNWRRKNLKKKTENKNKLTKNKQKPGKNKKN